MATPVTGVGLKGNLLVKRFLALSELREEPHKSVIDKLSGLTLFLAQKLWECRSESSGLKARISEVGEEFSVNETIACANPLEQPAFGAVVEELRQIPGGNAAFPENETEGKMLNASDATA